MDFWCGEHGILGVCGVNLAGEFSVWREFGGRILANARAQGAPCVARILKFGEFLVQISR